MNSVPALEEPLKKALGPATAKVMAEHLDLHTVGDLLHHYPRRYAERGELTRLADLPLDEHVTVVAQVASARILKFSGGTGQRLEVTITDGSGQLQLVFFGRGIHKPHKDLLPGTRAMFAGKASVFNRKMQLAHPAYELLRADALDAGEADEAIGSWWRPPPDLPGHRQAGVVEDRQGRRHGAAQRPGGPRAPAGLAA